MVKFHVRISPVFSCRVTYIRVCGLSHVDVAVYTRVHARCDATPVVVFAMCVYVLFMGCV